MKFFLKIFPVQNQGTLEAAFVNLLDAICKQEYTMSQSFGPFYRLVRVPELLAVKVTFKPKPVSYIT